MWQNPNNQNLTKLKNSNITKLKENKMWQKLKESICDKPIRLNCEEEKIMN